MSEIKSIIKSLLDTYATKKSAIESGLMFNFNVNGNKKLRNNDKGRFMIWNLPAVITCPYATELCKKFCYALKSERVYPDVLPSRQVNFDNSRQDDFTIRMIFTIEVLLRGKAYQGKKVVFRIHESGDFYNKAYAEKWLDVARYFEDRNDIVFMAYTKSFTYFKGQDIPSNMVVRASVWADTDQKQLSLINDMDLPIYTAYNQATVDDLVSRGIAVLCRCDDCAGCGACWDKVVKFIVCVIH